MDILNSIKKRFTGSKRQEDALKEKKAWEVLKDEKHCNCKLRKQCLIEGFPVDYYCNKLRLAIEIADEIVSNNQIEYDELMRQTIHEKGIEFIRITKEDINGDVLAQLKELIVV